MSVCLQSQPSPWSTDPADPRGSTRLEEIDQDAIDTAIDRGDLDTVRRLLGLSQPAWRLLLARL